MKKRFFRKILSGFVFAFCGGDPLVLGNIDVEAVVDRVGGCLKKMPVTYAIGLRCLILLVEYGIPPLVLKIRPMSSLPILQQVKYLDQWATSRFFVKRVGFIGLKFIFLPQIYSEAKLLQTLGYAHVLEERGGHRC